MMLRAGAEDLATVLERAGRIEEARDALERALTLYEQKRCLPYVSRVREQLDSLGQAKSDRTNDRGKSVSDAGFHPTRSCVARSRVSASACQRAQMLTDADHAMRPS